MENRTAPNKRDSPKKQTVKFDDVRKRREEQQERKKKREERISSTRKLLGAKTNSDDELFNGGDDPVPTEEMIADFFSNDPLLQIDATVQIRKLLAQEEHPPIEELLKYNVVTQLVSFLKGQKSLLQFEAAWVLTNIASGSSEQTQVVVDAGAVPGLIHLLSSPILYVREQAVWALGNIAADSPTHVDYILERGALKPMLALLREPNDLPTLRIASWALSNVFRSKPHWDSVSSAITVFAKLLNSSDEEILIDICWAISSILDGANDKIRATIDAGVCQRLVSLLVHPSAFVQTAALRSVGNIATGNDIHFQILISSGAFPTLLSLLSSRRESIRRETCRTISSITAGSPKHVLAVISANIIPSLISILNLSETDSKTRVEACSAISNATYAGLSDPDQIRYLVAQGCIETLCHTLKMVDSKIILLALNGLDNILIIGKRHRVESGEGALNYYALSMKEAGGLTAINNLQSHVNEEISKKSFNILNKYFRYLG